MPTSSLRLCPEENTGVSLGAVRTIQRRLGSDFAELMAEISSFIICNDRAFLRFKYDYVFKK